MTFLDRPALKHFAARSRRVSDFIGRRIFPQGVRTAAIALLWLGFSPIWIAAVSGTSNESGALMACVGLALFASISTHVWGTRTPPWRTVFWTFMISILVGAFAYLGGLNRFALDLAILIAVIFVVLRLNENGRRLVRLVRAYRITR
ncbi:hypothetical protein GCM10025867_46810 (plasmid) [Frondihabitans sucicola]|uniref:Uncharacterized protein n=1 Tax=Frondihabitans sucicola TaxID=1268041 RepID=A0ABN6Y943_9MICO|nr:hypothetical protein [Frondihabitans sucicola]BDZ52440.1 hypothetical protein GCM10025867_46810 [Frondihabitans sucicola]